MSPFGMKLQWNRETNEGGYCTATNYALTAAPTLHLEIGIVYNRRCSLEGSLCEEKGSRYEEER
jgi:hypothetical protein